MTKIFNVAVLAEKEKVLEFLLNPINLKYWTVHTNLIVIEDKCYEITSSLDEKTRIIVDHKNHYFDDCLEFVWVLEEEIKKQFQFLISKGINNKTNIEVLIPSTVLGKKLSELQNLLQVEFKILEQLLNNGKYEIAEFEKEIMNEYHKKLC